MKLFKYFQVSLESIVAHKLRASLTMLGIIIGVAAVLTTMGMGRGAAANITERIESQGTNLLTISPGASNVGGLNPVVEVWAVIVPPGNRSADQPVIDSPKVSLLDEDGDETYEATYDGFAAVGTYRVLVYAEDQMGAISLPQQITVEQLGASGCCL